MKHHIQINNIQLTAWEYGKTGDFVIFLHPGGLFSSFVWDRVVEQLQPFYRIITVDLRGHGESDKPLNGYELENLAKDIEMVMDYFEIEKAHIVGNSLGAEVAVVMAANSKRVRSLTLIDGGMINYLGPNGQMEGTKEEIVDFYLNRKLLEFETNEDFSNFMETKLPQTLTYLQEPIITANIMASICDLDLDRIYDKITSPILFLPAELEDKLDIKLENINRWKEKLPYSKVIMIPNSEHIMTAKHSDEIAAEIHSFISDL
jgi:2-succinyl-6-hydroxy-2,4-cyclohexadiene-1-carboxylate synthase